MKEEDIIRKHAGSENPFRVPEGYFEDFTSRLMSGLPQAEDKPQKRTRTISLRPRLIRYAAAAVVVIAAGAIVGSRFIGDGNKMGTSQALAQDNGPELASADYNELDEALDYAMLDNMDITYYLTEAY